MTPNTKVELYWQNYLNSLPPHKRPTEYSAWGFGDGGTMADELGQLVRDGLKTATCSLLWEYEADGEPLPQVGQLSIILNGVGEPLCIIETVSVTEMPYNKVPPDFAYDEGEGDRSLAYWRQAHWRFFSRVCELIDRDVSQTMPLVCERFKVVYR